MSDLSPILNLPGESSLTTPVAQTLTLAEEDNRRNFQSPGEASLPGPTANTLTLADEDNRRNSQSPKPTVSPTICFAEGRKKKSTTLPLRSPPSRYSVDKPSDILDSAIRRWEEKHAHKAHSLHARKAQGKVKLLAKDEPLDPAENEPRRQRKTLLGSSRPFISSPKSAKTSRFGKSQELREKENATSADRDAETVSGAANVRSTPIKGISTTDTEGAIGIDPLLYLKLSRCGESRRTSTLTVVRNFLRDRLETGTPLPTDSRCGSVPGCYTTIDRGGGGVPFDGAFSPEFNARVQEKMLSDGLTRRQALSQARIERMVEVHGSPDKALYFLIDRCPNQPEMKILLETLLTEGVDLSIKDSDGRSPLHAAVERGFVHVARVLMENATATEETDADGNMAVELALQDRNDEMAALIMKNMTQATVRSLFEVDVSLEDKADSKPRFNFYDLVGSGVMKETVAAVLDSLVEPEGVADGYAFHYSILEADCDGNNPRNEHFIMGSKKTTFQRLLEIEALRTHNAVRMLIHRKWSSYGERSAIRNVAMYIIFVLLVSFSLISAAQQRVDVSLFSENRTTKIQLMDIRVYNTPESVFRAITEITVIIAILLNVYQEVQEMRAIGLREYVTNAYNYLQLVTAFLIILLIPLRWADVDAQWYVASVTYVLVCLRTLQLISITRISGIYLQILTRIVVQDITRFAIMFAIFWLTFSGAFFFILVGTTQHIEGGTTGTSLDVAKNADSYSKVLLSSLRVMIEGEAIFDYIDQGYHWLAVGLMMVFLFIVLIVILNILIAQLSDTYAEVKSDAQRTLEKNWGQTLRNIEQTDKFKELRFKTYAPYEVVKHPEDHLLEWDKPVNLEVARENERKQRHIEQQLAKQEQQLMAIRYQLRTAINMSKVQEDKHNALQDMLHEMLKAQLPDLMEEVITRSTANVITSVDSSSARSVQTIQETVRQNLIEEVSVMLDAAVEDVIYRVGGIVVDGDTDPI